MVPMSFVTPTKNFNRIKVRASGLAPPDYLGPDESPVKSRGARRNAVALLLATSTRANSGGQAMADFKAQWILKRSRFLARSSHD